MKFQDLIPWKTSNQKDTPETSIITSLQRDIDKLFDNFFVKLKEPASMWKGYEFTPSLDILEEENEYKVHVELAGIPKENVKIEVDRHALIVSGKKEKRTEKEGKNWKHLESLHGEFTRTIALPNDAKEDSITAKMSNGILEIKIPKEKETVSSNQRTIKIET